jgi:predicted transcriptional regulator of viral defense system
MAIHVKARRPRVDWPPIKFVYASGRAWTFGVEQRNIEGAVIRITSPAKTVADCFKYRSTVGLDVALEALREYLDRRGRSVDELLDAADACRVRRIMMPYVESLA